MIVSNNQHSIQAVTHAGIFHADEVMATAILGRCGITQVSRVLAVPEGLDESVIVFDIGGGKYDHHQKAGKPLRTNGTPYAACGLIWRDFGRRACAGILGQVSPSLLETVWEAVDRTMIRPIDLIDNGEIEKGKSSLSALISDFNPCWNSVEDADASFLRAVELADTVLCNRVRVCAATAEAEELVKDALRGADGPVLVLDRFAPWKTALESAGTAGERILFVVYPAIRGGFNCQCVPRDGNPFAQKCPLPLLWRGLRQEELRRITGVQTALFCHPGGFLCGAETEEDAIKLATIAMEVE